jgi:branched-chain amino acid transport system substrate-binding protein
MHVLPRLIQVAMRISIAALTASIVIASSARPALAADPYTIDVLLSLTGPTAFVGQSFNRAFAAYETYANKAGGIDGRPVHFVFHDNEANPTVSVQLVNSIKAANPHAAVILGPDLTATCAAVAPILVTGPVQYCISPGFTPNTEEAFSFAQGASMDSMVKAYVTFLRVRKYTKLALVLGTDATGQAVESALESVMKLPENASVQFVTREHLGATDISAAAQAAHVKASGAQAVLAIVTGTPFGTLLRSLKDAGVDLPIETSLANGTKEAITQYQAMLPPALYFNAGLFEDPSATRGGVHKAIDDFTTVLRQNNLEPNPNYGMAWDVADIVVQSLRKLGPNASATQLRDYLLGLRAFPGIWGSYNFANGNRHGLNDNAVLIVGLTRDDQRVRAFSGPGGVLK